MWRWSETLVGNVVSRDEHPVNTFLLLPTVERSIFVLLLLNVSDFDRPAEVDKVCVKADEQPINTSPGDQNKYLLY